MRRRLGQLLVLRNMQEAAHTLKVRLQSLEVRGPEPDLE